MTRTLMIIVLALSVVTPARALPPRTLADVDATPAAGSALPARVQLHDEDGSATTLSRYLGARPMVLVLGYYGCSNLCSLVLQGLHRALDDAGVRPGRDVEVVVLSIAAQETPAMARAKRRDVLGDGGDARGWHFLTAEQPAIDAVTRALGYRYAWDDGIGQFAHPAGLTIVDAQGRVSATLPGIAYPPATLRGALSAADRRPSGAVAGTPWLLCFGDDPHAGRYSTAALNAVRVVALAALLALAAYWAAAHARGRRRRNP